jgi:hypothetical protein
MNWTEEQLAEHYARLKQPQGAEPPPRSDVPEVAIQEECVKLMEEDGWRALRTDPVSDRSRGKGFGELGMADYMFIRYRPPTDWQAGMAGLAEVIWVEFKSRRGKPSKQQAAWHHRERSSGALTWIASVDFPASVEGFKAHYRANGLQRRKDWGL